MVSVIWKPFLAELKENCEKAEIDYGEIENWVVKKLKEPKMLSYFITLEPHPESPSSIMDMVILTSKFIHGFDVRKKEKIYSLYRARSITSITEETKEEEKKVIVTFHLDSIGYGLAADIRRIDELRKFVDDVQKQAWGK